MFKGIIPFRPFYSFYLFRDGVFFLFFLFFSLSFFHFSFLVPSFE